MRKAAKQVLRKDKKYMQIEKNLNSQARKRLELLFDGGEYTEIGSYSKEKDNLAGVITAFGEVNGSNVYAFSQDITIESGAVGAVQAAKIAKLYELAAKTGSPVVGIYDSNGAFIDGGVSPLLSYGEMLSAASAVSGVVPQISVIAGPCVGCAVLLALSADFVILSEDGEIAMSSLSEKSDSSALVCAVCADDKSSIEKARNIIDFMPDNNLSGAPVFAYDDPEEVCTGDFASLAVSIADEGRLTELSEHIGKASYTALCSIGGSTAGIVATNKTKDRLTSQDAAKIAHFVRTCDAFAIPVVTFVDTEGFEKGGTDEVKSIVQLSSSYSEATSAKISVITGKAQEAAFVALAGKNVNSDFTFAYETASIASMEPLAAAEFLWHDKLCGADDIDKKREELAAEYLSTLASAESAASAGAVDDIITPEDTRKVLISALDALAGKRVQKLPKKHNNIPL